MPISVSHKRIDIELVEMTKEICDKYNLPFPDNSKLSIPDFISGNKYYLDFNKFKEDCRIDFLYMKIDWYAQLFLNGVLLDTGKYYWDRDYHNRTLKFYFSDFKYGDVVTICWNEIDFDLRVV